MPTSAMLPVAPSGNSPRTSTVFDAVCRGESARLVFSPRSQSAHPSLDFVLNDLSPRAIFFPRAAQDFLSPSMIGLIRWQRFSHKRFALFTANQKLRAHFMV